MTAGFSRAFNQKVINVLDCADGVRIDRYVVGGTIVDSAPAFTEALRRARALGGATIYMPRGNYYCSHEVENDGPNHWKGDGAGGFYFGGTQVYFPAGVHGFINQSEHLSSTQGSGEWATFSDFSILALGKTAGTWKHGLKVHRSCDVTRVTVGYIGGPCNHGFSGNGVHIVGATDVNVLDARQFWNADTAYTVGDILRKVGSARNLMSVVSGTLALTASGNSKGTVVIARSVDWTTTPSQYDLISIESGSALAGAGNANVGLYFVDPNITSPVTDARTINCRKISDSPYLVTGFYTEPVTVAATGAYATTAVKAYAQSTYVYACVAPGTSSSGGEPSGTDADGIELDDDLVPGGLAWRYVTQIGVCNDMQLTSVRSADHGGNAMYIEGYDANQIRNYSFSGTSTPGYAIDDQSFLGCLHVGAHTSDNDKGPFRNAFHGNSRTQFLECYAESGQGTGSLVFTPGQIIGGIQESGIHAETTGLYVLGGRFSGHYTQETQAGKVLTWTVLRNSPAAPLFSAGEATHTDDPDGIQFFAWDADAGGWAITKTNCQSSLRFFGGDFRGLVQASGFAIRTGYGAVGSTPAATEPGVRTYSTNGYPLVGTGAQNHFYAGDVIENKNYASDNIRGWRVFQNCGSGPSWSAGLGALKEGATVQPSAPNGYIYRRHSTSTAGAYTTGGSEPTWPTSFTPGSNLTTSDNGIIWECFGYTGVAIGGSTPVTLIALEYGALNNATGAPGNVVVTAISELHGIAKIAAGSSAIEISHPYARTKIDVSATLQYVDTTLTQILSVIPTLGTITIRGNAIATNDTQVAWRINL